MKIMLSAVAALAMLTSVASAQQVVRIGSEGAYPPYNFINDQNELDGYERELGDELCRRAELTCEWVINDWDSIIPNLVSSNYDAIMAGMSITPEREAVIAFTQNYLQPEASAYVALADSDATVIDGVVAAQSNTIQAGHVAETDATLVEFATPDESVAAVRSGEADAVLADRDFLVPIVEGSNGELVFIGEPVLIGGGIGMGVRQSDTELKATFDAAIAEMKADGSINEIIKKWFGEDAQTF
jgi:polar amino acid transport system substrate-binding protein